MAIFRFDPRKPGKAEAVLYSNIDLAQPFVARIWGLLDILKLTSYQKQKEINDSILSLLFECLLPAHISLENIKKHSATAGIAELDKQKDYFDLHNHLWAAYKDRMQLIFQDSEFEIGFLFQKDADFEKGLSKLKTTFPSLTVGFIESITRDRNTWQKDIAMIRNDYIQHKKIPPEIASKYFTEKNAEIIFNNTWMAIEQIVLNFLVQEFPRAIKIIEIPKELRDPTMPKKYRLGI